MKIVNLGKIKLILRKENMNQVVWEREKQSYFGVVHLVRGTKEFKEKERITWANLPNSSWFMFKRVSTYIFLHFYISLVWFCCKIEMCVLES